MIEPSMCNNTIYYIFNEYSIYIYLKSKYEYDYIYYMMIYNVGCWSVRGFWLKSLAQIILKPQIV